MFALAKNISPCASEEREKSDDSSSERTESEGRAKSEEMETSRENSPRRPAFRKRRATMPGNPSSCSLLTFRLRLQAEEE